MGRGTTRRRAAKQSGRPSVFFIVALILGVAFLIWAFSKVIMKPAGRVGRTQTPVVAATV